MKTAPSTFLHFSGYPIPVAAPDNDKQTGLQRENSDPIQKITVTLIKAKPDVPENWDESWFANYE